MPSPEFEGFPAGLPVRIDGPGAWYGPQAVAEGGWIETLSTPQLDEIEAGAQPGLARVERDPRAMNELVAADFPLPALAPRIARLADALLNGRGFVVLRG